MSDSRFTMSYGESNAATKRSKRSSSLPTALVAKWIKRAEAARAALLVEAASLNQRHRLELEEARLNLKEAQRNLEEALQKAQLNAEEVRKAQRNLEDAQLNAKWAQLKVRRELLEIETALAKVDAELEIYRKHAKPSSARPSGKPAKESPPPEMSNARPSSAHLVNLKRTELSEHSACPSNKSAQECAASEHHSARQSLKSAQESAAASEHSSARQSLKSAQESAAALEHSSACQSLKSAQISAATEHSSECPSKPAQNSAATKLSSARPSSAHLATMEPAEFHEHGAPTAHIEPGHETPLLGAPISIETTMASTLIECPPLDNERSEQSIAAVQRQVQRQADYPGAQASTDRQPTSTPRNPLGATECTTQDNEHLHQSLNTVELQTQRQVEPTEMLAKSHTLSTLPQRNIPPFNGDPLAFSSFMPSSEQFVESKTNNDVAKLPYLELNTAGGHARAKKPLDDRFCNELTIAAGYKQKTAKWPKIKSDNGRAVSDFSSFRTTRQNAMASYESTEEMNSKEFMINFFTKLPYKLMHRWKRRQRQAKESYGARLKFAQLVDFIDQQARL